MLIPDLLPGREVRLEWRPPELDDPVLEPRAELARPFRVEERPPEPELEEPFLAADEARAAPANPFSVEDKPGASLNLRISRHHLSWSCWSQF